MTEAIPLTEISRHIDYLVGAQSTDADYVSVLRTLCKGAMSLPYSWLHETKGEINQRYNILHSYIRQIFLDDYYGTNFERGQEKLDSGDGESQLEKRMAIPSKLYLSHSFVRRVN